MSTSIDILMCTYVKNQVACAILNSMAHAFPFSAIVGQDEMKHAILVAAVDPGVGGVLVFGDAPDVITWLGMAVIALGMLLSFKIKRWW